MLNSSPTPVLFAACVDGKFHVFPRVRDCFLALARVYEPATPPFLPNMGKVDIRKVKTDQLTLLPSWMYALSPQSGLKFGRESIRMLC